jgi:hypothetical protein
MGRVKTGLLVTLALLLIIQFIQPARNAGRVPPVRFEEAYHVPGDVQAILQTSCYDCHSNTTRYPWYSTLQPGAWWMASHIKEGKEELNFSDFNNYSRRRQQSKLRAIAGSVKEGTMPLRSYTLLHGKAKLSEHDKLSLLNWAIKTKDSLSVTTK